MPILRTAVRLLTLVMLGAALAACAATDGPAEDLPGCRVQLRTVADWTDLDALAARAAAASGLQPATLPVAAIGPRWFALSLQAPHAEACRQGLDRLAQDRTLVAELLPESLRRRPAAPPRSLAR